MLKLILSVLLLSSLLLLTNCAGAPPDVPICIELAPERGYCTRIMTGKQFEVNDQSKLEGKTWWEGKPSTIMMPASSWREIKKWIIKICKNNSQCDSQVSGWNRTVQTIDDQVSDRSGN